MSLLLLRGKCQLIITKCNWYLKITTIGKNINEIYNTLRRLRSTLPSIHTTWQQPQKHNRHRHRNWKSSANQKNKKIEFENENNKLCCCWQIAFVVNKIKQTIRKHTHRFHDEEHANLLNAMWLTAITFLCVGYGDIVPNTYCGRGITLTCGMVVSIPKQNKKTEKKSKTKHQPDQPLEHYRKAKSKAKHI